MERTQSLDGNWKLYYYNAVDGAAYTEAQLDNAEVSCISARVPGNVELDLSRAGLHCADVFKGMATSQAEKWESFDWWYSTEFNTPAHKESESVWLRFEGVDCLAEYYLNGIRIGESDNSFIPHEWDVTSYLRTDRCNQLRVHLRSALLEQFTQSYEAYLSYAGSIGNGIFLRKPAHSFGWDIFPRAVTAGLWKSVTISVRDEYEFEDIGYYVRMDGQKNPSLRFFCSVKAPAQALIDGSLSVRIRGYCGSDSSLSGEYNLRRAKVARIDCNLQNPKLWWPYGYGNANVYETTVQLCCGETVLAERKLNIGLRTVELQRTDSLKDDNACFRFKINGTEIMCKGSNWVPLDAYHSRDIERYKKALELASDIGCNILRVWGGGVYEQDCFYDYCDRHGILVWQDFMMACQVCPMNEAMLRNMEKEFTVIIKALRSHPCLALWSGDNEIDESLASSGINPSMNRITRELLPRLVTELDAFRPYLPSSPYISERAYEDYSKGHDVFVERHLWGARDYYKANFYANSNACFVSETGYHGCPSPESVRKIVDEDCVWPYDNEQWILHSSDQNGHDGRVRLMEKQIRQLFAFEPQTLEDFSLASQISQAEAKKYFIERIRLGRPYKSGVIWWNLIDGWPQMSDAVVDYFYDRKLAFDFIKRAQAPFAMMMREMNDWNYTLTAANDTLKEMCGTYRVLDIDNEQIYAEGSFKAAANGCVDVTRIPMMYSEQHMLLIEWTIDGHKSYNHYLCGMPSFSFPLYVGWLHKLQTICAER